MSNNDIPIPSGYEVYWEPWIDAYDNEEINSRKELYEEIEEEEVLFEKEDEPMPEPFFATAAYVAFGHSVYLMGKESGFINN